MRLCTRLPNWDWDKPPALESVEIRLSIYLDVQSFNVILRPNQSSWKEIGGTAEEEAAE